jgi:hypothetical protein
MSKPAMSEALNSARAQLDEACRKTLQPMQAGPDLTHVSVIEDDLADLHEKLTEEKEWADEFETATGRYPGIAVELTLRKLGVWRSRA